MLKFLKNFFGAKPTVAPCDDVPYKVEPKKSDSQKKPAVKKKPEVKKATTRKPRAKKAQ